MPRNKYPEETVQKILDVATRLFSEQGYENTTIGDIVDGLGGMTRGAVYHHFKNKEEILDAVTTRLFHQNDPFSRARKQTDDGLLQMQLTMRFVVQDAPDHERIVLNRQEIGLMREPKFLAQHFNDCLTLAETEILPMIELANAQGRTQVQYPKQAAEILMLILNLWITYSPARLTRSEFEDRLNFSQQTLAAMGLPVLDDTAKQYCMRAYGSYFDGEESK